jgi:hypothetical protein
MRLVDQPLCQPAERLRHQRVLVLLLLLVLALLLLRCVARGL